MRDEWRLQTGGPGHERATWAPPARHPGPLTIADVRIIRAALVAPYWADPAEVAAWAGCSRSMVSQIKTRAVYSHVDPEPVVGSRAAGLRLGSFDTRRGQKARTRAAVAAVEALG